MRKIFADTGYWIALLNPDDALHQKARSLTISLKNVPIVSSETDCTSFQIMQQQNILEALAYDKHFEQAGFVALLR